MEFVAHTGTGTGPDAARPGGRLIARALFLLLLLAPLSAPGADWPEPPRTAAPPAEDMARLEAGEVLVETTRLDEAGGAARARALFQIDPADLWQTLGDCEANFRFVRGLRECEIEQQDARSAVTRQSLKPYALLPRIDYRFATRREPYEWIQLRLIDGELRTMEGSWRFDLVGEPPFVLLTHEIHIQPKVPAPRWLARRTLQKDLGNLLACLRWETAAWPDPRQRGLDRERCP